MAFGVNPRTGKPGPAPAPQRDGDKVQARATVNRLVRTGYLPRPSDLPCVDCGRVWEPGERRHEYDHYNGYGEGFHLDVVVVCSLCHAIRDSKRKKQTRCINGHSLADAYIAKNGTRHCKECRRASDRQRGRDAAWWRNYRREKRGQESGNEKRT